MKKQYEEASVEIKKVRGCVKLAKQKLGKTVDVQDVEDVMDDDGDDWSSDSSSGSDMGSASESGEGSPIEGESESDVEMGIINLLKDLRAALELRSRQVGGGQCSEPDGRFGLAVASGVNVCFRARVTARPPEDMLTSAS